MPPPRKQGAALSGRNTRKVKSGCRTCKIRKVKCDEGRPACTRCVSSGRSCDGYGIWDQGKSSSKPSPSSSDETIITSTNSKVPIPRKATNPSQPKIIDCGAEIVTDQRWDLHFTSVPNPLLVSPGATQERGLISWYQECTAGKIAGLFPSEFWNGLLLQVSHSEPAVFQAVLALTSAHKYEKPKTTFKQPSAEEQFTLQAYTKAIQHLKPHFNLQDKASLRITLITCILFVCLEIVQRHYASATTHLRNGLKLIQQSNRKWSLNDTVSLSSSSTGSDHMINQMFLELLIQMKMLGANSASICFISNVNFAARLPKEFLSTREARVHLDTLIAQALEFGDLCRSQDPLQKAWCELSDQQARIQVDLDSWLQIFSASGFETSPQSSPYRMAACCVLRMYHTMAMIITATCTFPDEEISFDYHGADFAAIVSYAIQAKTVIHGTYIPDVHLSGTSGETDGTIIDIGWIPALYYTAIKCRIRHIRSRAIRLLEITRHREGIWDARIAALTASEVMRIEQDESPGTFTIEDFSLDIGLGENHVVVPRSRRLHDVAMVPPNDSKGRPGLRCRRRLDDHSGWEEIEREYDAASGTWLDTSWFNSMLEV